MDQMKDKTILAHKIVFRSSKNSEGRLIPAEEVEKEPLNQETLEIRQRFGQVGDFRFICCFMNDSYVGFDCETLLEFKIVKDDTSRDIPDYDKETVAALKGPGLVQSLLDTGAGESSAEESDGDDGKPKDEIEVLKEKLRKAGLEKAAEKRDTQLVN
jgi:hypothetical protein